ncbi:MAG: hypothetical protein ACK58T_30630 [Phycisphaerae bacterium]
MSAVAIPSSVTHFRMARETNLGAKMSGVNLAWADITHMAGDAALEGANLFGVRRG